MRTLGKINSPLVVVLAGVLAGCAGEQDGETCECGILQFEDNGPAKGTLLVRRREEW
ncbi:MAG: hypothetical protein JKY37_19425 [Nannocystaceae bacterium]|nr:hypothetical protein [Nannocystaceae bacterium]